MMSAKNSFITYVLGCVGLVIVVIYYVPRQQYVRTISKNGLEPKILPMHNFSYIIENKHLCKVATPLYCFIYIYSAPSQFKERQRIRETWGRLNMLKNVHSKTAFFLGRTHDRNVTRKLLAESKKHGDIILANYLDSYNNLTHKGVMSLEWMNKHCNAARYYVKVDTDVLLNVFILRKSIDTYLGNAKRSFLCWVWVHNGAYPKYCSGPTWVFTADLLPLLYRASFHVPFELYEDAYTSGLLARELGNVSHIGPAGLMETMPHGAQLARFTSSNRRIPLVTVPESRIYNQAWSALLGRLSDNDRKQFTNEYTQVLKSRQP